MAADERRSERRGDWIQTYCGVQFWPLDPRPEEVRIEDIAHALSNQCRYSGHVETFYSVAEHCYRASLIVPPADALWALLHDASEAYLVDLPRPIKHFSDLGSCYRKIESAVMCVICERFGLGPDEPDTVAKADAVLLSTEKRDLMKIPPKPRTGENARPLVFRIRPMTPLLAELAFLGRFEKLTTGLACGASAVSAQSAVSPGADG